MITTLTQHIESLRIPSRDMEELQQNIQAIVWKVASVLIG